MNEAKIPRKQYPPILVHKTDMHDILSVGLHVHVNPHQRISVRVLICQVYMSI